MSPHFETALRFCLGFSFWTATALICWVMLRQAGSFLRLLTPGSRWQQAQVIRGAGADGSFARAQADQVGRALIVQPRSKETLQEIWFHDLKRDSAVFGGEVRDPRGQTTKIHAAPQAVLWAPPSVLLAQGPQTGDAAAYQRSKSANGLTRTLTHRVGAGDVLWVWTRSSGEASLVSLVPPRRLAITYALAVLCCALGTLAAASAITYGALTFPPESVTAQLSAAVGLIYFLLVQPFGVWVRDRFAAPDRARIDGKLRCAQ